MNSNGTNVVLLYPVQYVLAGALLAIISVNAVTPATAGHDVLILSKAILPLGHLSTPHGDGDKRTKRSEATFAELGSADLMVASSVTWSLPETEERLWLPAAELSKKLTAKLKGRWPLEQKSGATFRDYLTDRNPTLLKTAAAHRSPLIAGRPDRNSCRRIALIAPEVTSAGPFDDSFIISRGTAHAETGMNCSIVFANGDVTCNDDVRRVIIVTDGDIRIKRLAAESILIARGTIYTHSAYESTLIAGQKIKVTRKEPAPLDPFCKNTITEGEAHPLGVIRFFELSQVGLEVVAKDNTVQIAKLTPASPLRKAGAEVGDTISKVNGLFVTNADETRRALRDGIAMKCEGTLNLIRGDKKIELRVTFPE